jgi:hypothetical protein
VFTEFGASKLWTQHKSARETQTLAADTRSALDGGVAAGGIAVGPRRHGGSGLP